MVRHAALNRGIIVRFYYPLPVGHSVVVRTTGCGPVRKGSNPFVPPKKRKVLLKRGTFFYYYPT